MNVACFVNPDYGGGIARHTREMVLGLARRPGVSVEILASRTSLGKNADLARAFHELPIRHLPFSNVTLERLWKAAGWPRVDGYVSSTCDVIYAPAHARLPSRGIPTVMTIHDIQAFEPDLPWSNTPEHRTFHRKWRSWLPKAAREATRILTVSEFSKRRIAELAGVDPSKIGVVGNGVSDVFFQARRPPHAPRQPSVVVVGGLRTKKGAADTLAVARILADRCSPLQIDVVGDNEHRWVAESRLLPNVHLHGPLPDEKLADMLAQASSLLFLSPYEGFGIPAVEAMAAGTPAVVANAAALPEVVGGAGLIIDSKEHEQIAHELHRLHVDLAVRNEMLIKGFEHAARHTWAACVNRLLDQLRQIAGTRHADC